MPKNLSNRKQDHISLTNLSRVDKSFLDDRFVYEPMLSGHPNDEENNSIKFLGKTLKTPIWVSSMTGGTKLAKKINRNLAQACHEFGMGMGLGSCRSLLDDDQYLEDFDVRSIMGDRLPLYANLGIAQIEQLLATKQQDKIKRLLDKLSADGLIIHVNPLQEWTQPEGDRFLFAPIQTIENIILHFPNTPIIVKEVGQGMGYHSLKALLQLPLAAIEFAAAGGTNFTKLELLRNSQEQRNHFEVLNRIGHSADEMVGFVNKLVDEMAGNIRCQEIIISGGISDFLDGYYLTQKIKLNAIYGQASALLNHAKDDYESLHYYLEQQSKGLNLAKRYLRIRDEG